MTERKTLLHVEDSAFCVRAVARALRPLAGHLAIETVSDGEAALERLGLLGNVSVAPPDVVILDLSLPRISGLEVLDAMRAEPRTAALPVVVFSTSPYHGDVRRAQERGVAAYLTKEVDPEEIIEIIEKIIG